MHRGWRIGSVANGGYVLALVGRTLSEALNQPDPLSINAFYLAPVALGEVEVAVESLSEHPVADAIVRAARAEGAPLVAAEGFQSVTGYGVRAVVEFLSEMSREAYISERALIDRLRAGGSKHH